jgi:hypothetical protein
MRAVTRIAVPVAVILAAVGSAGAQVTMTRPAVLITPVAPVEPRALPVRGSMVERLLSFDANADDRIGRDEFPERMADLVGRGDANADGALDPDEIRALVNAMPPERRDAVFRAPPAFGLAEVVSDLKLPPPTLDKAMEIVRVYTPFRNVNDATSADLFTAMRAVLNDEDYESFVAGVRRIRGRVIVGGLVQRVPAR